MMIIVYVSKRRNGKDSLFSLFTSKRREVATRKGKSEMVVFVVSGKRISLASH